MPALRTNILANYAGQAWMVLMSVAFVPLYIHILGIEAFGLVGFMLSLQTLSQLFDFGIGGVINRELAHRAHSAERHQPARDLVRTFELLVWPLSLLIGLAISLASPFIAHSWLHPQHLSHNDTAAAVSIMGLVVASMWPTSFYSSGLSGLEQQMRLNLINATFATLRGVGVLPLLYWVSPTIDTFMWWYAAVGICQSLVLATALWLCLPRGNRAAVFNIMELRNAKRFAGGLFAITALSLGLSQLDRLTISAMRPLEELGYYALALSVAAGLGRMVQPMFNALYPRFSRLVATNDTEGLSNLYHLSSQCVAVVIAAVSLVLIVFAKDVLYLWTGDSALATRIALPLAILVAGTAFNGLMNLPYAMQLANGWTRLTVGMNLISLMLGIPFCIWAVSHYGMVGAASLWLLINLGFFAIGIPLMHRRLLRGEMVIWYVRDILPPALAAAAAALVLGFSLPAISRSIQGVFLLGVVSFATLGAAASASPSVRDLVRQWSGLRFLH
jgi:O-antigen/teichoic acid export membrane protein